jgi:hypothetical protein
MGHSPLKDAVQHTRKEPESKGAMKTVNAFQITATLPDRDNARATIIAIVMRWAAKTLGIEQVGEHTSFASEHASMEIIDASENNAWAMRLEEHPADLANGQNIHEVELITRPTEVVFVYRLTVAKFPGPEHCAPRQVPKFAYDIAEAIGLNDGGRTMDGTAWIINEDSDLERFYSFLSSEDRKLPVYMVTETGRSSPNGFATLVDSQNLAHQCLGVAHVVLMTYQMGYLWTQRVGKWLSAYLGTVRTYQPNTPINEENKHRHPLAMPERIASWAHEDMQGPAAFSKFLQLQAMQASASPQNWREQFIPISTLKSMAMAGDLDFTAETQWQEVEKRYQRRISVLEERVAEMAQDALSLSNENAKLKSENALLSAKLHQGERVMSVRSPRQAEEQVRDLRTAASGDVTVISDWVATSLAGKVRLSEDAIGELSEVRDDQFADVSLMKACLSLLGAEVRAALSRSEHPTKSKIVRDALQSIHPRAVIEPIDADELQRYEQEYTFDLDGDEDFMVRWVLKIGETGEDEKDLRIYFDFDINSQSILVGHMPNYLFPGSSK